MVDTKHDTTFTFSRDERLKSRKLIEQLFRRKLFVQDSTLRIYFSTADLQTSFPAQFAFTVSKKNFPKSPHRNRIKRLMREGIRYKKPDLYLFLEQINKKLLLLLSYQGKEQPALEEINNSIQVLLPAILNEIKQS